MTVLPATPSGVLALIYKFTVGADQNVSSKLHFRYTGGPPSSAQLAAFAASVEGDFVTHLAPQLCSNYSLNALEVLDLANPATIPGQWTGAQAGSRAGTPLPAGVAVVISYPIARRYRGGHPRGYWPFFIISDVLGPAAWQTANLGSLQTSFLAHITAIKAITTGGVTVGNQCSVSYYSGGHWVAGTGAGKPKWVPTLRATPVIDDVTAVIVRPRPGSQRRRQHKA